MSVTAELEWGDPPPAYGSTRWHAISLSLRARPGVWAKVAEVSPDRVSNAYAGLKSYGCEVTTRTLVRNHRVGVWARWPA